MRKLSVLFLCGALAGCTPTMQAALADAKQSFDAVERVRLGCEVAPKPPEVTDGSALTRDDKRALLAWTVAAGLWLTKVQKAVFEAPEPAAVSAPPSTPQH